MSTFLRIRRSPLCLFSVLLFFPLAFASAQLAADEIGEAFEAAVSRLAEADSYDAKFAAAEIMSTTGDPRVADTLDHLLEGNLYTQRSDGLVVIAATVDGGYQISSVLTGDDLGTVGRRDVTRIGVNNSLRSQLRTLLATFGLRSEDPDDRIEAVREMGSSADTSLLEPLIAVQDSETDSGVLKAIDRAIATLNLESDLPEVLLPAIESLGSTVDSHVRNKLTALVASENLDPTVREAARESLAQIEGRARFYEFGKTIFFGLSLGSILVLAAIGLSVTFGIMGVINMAHGELIMLGAYTTYVVQTMFPNAIDYSLFIAVPLAFCISGLMGIAIERGIVRFLYGRPLETLLATFGVSLLLQQGVRSIFSPLNRAVSTPSWMSGSIEIVPGLELTMNRVCILVFSMAVFAILLCVLRYTRLGLEMRAVTQNRAMAKAMGIRTSRVDALTFGLGAGIAGVAGVALSQLTNVGPNLGQSYIVDSFMVVVFGGVGNIWGTLVGGLSLGVANKLIEPVAGAVLAKILVLVFIILFIQKRPRGLFPQKGRAAD